MATVLVNGLIAYFLVNDSLKIAIVAAYIGSCRLCWGKRGEKLLFSHTEYGVIESDKIHPDS